MPRFSITLPDKVYELLAAESERTGAPLSLLVRRYVESGLQADGYDIGDKRTTWGGKRPRQTDKKQADET